MKILLTGFEPFGGEKINPSFLAAELTAKTFTKAEVSLMRLPVVYYRSAELACEEIVRIKPDVFLAVGQAGWRASVSFERVAVNLADSDSPDNDGVILHKTLYPDGADRLFSTLPILDAVTQINTNGLPAYVSDNAGRYVCNSLLYGVLKFIGDKSLDVRAGFAHVPYIPEQTVAKPTAPSMSLDNIAASLSAALTVFMR